jgi:oligoendopeptidase F
VVFDYSALPRDYQRHYIPADLGFDWGQLSRVYDDLASRQLRARGDLEGWLRDEAELNSYVYEQRTIRYINSTRQTDNPEFTAAYERYVEELEPKLKVANFELLKRYAASPARAQLPRAEYGLEDRRRLNAVSIFREENVELERQDSTLAQKYFRTTGAQTVNFRGQERTLQQMSKFYEDTDRATREEAWRLSTERFLADSGLLDEIYDQMIAIRDKIARNAGFSAYREYIFAKKDRFDYSPADCARFHKAVEEHLVPLSRDIDRERQKRMGLDELRPWDMRVDPDSRPPLSPFLDSAELVGRAAKVVGEMDHQLAGYFGRMTELDLLDLDSRKGKAPGGYQEELTEVRLPFIFMNSAKRDSDLRTFLHECGHSFHTFLMRDAGLPYFNAGANLPTEFAEVASTSMEIISGAHYAGSFYSEADARRSNLEEVASNIKLFTWVATIDSFQHWVYTHPGHSHEERTKAWVDTFSRFSGLESYEGLERSRAYRWQRQLHLFEVPFYYIEYGIALTGALGIWSRYREDQSKALGAYKEALSLGASRSLPELFGAAGLEWDFGPKALDRFSGELRAAIREYDERPRAH